MNININYLFSQIWSYYYYYYYFHKIAYMLASPSIHPS
jgi:hypothetical protein